MCSLNCFPLLPIVPLPPRRPPECPRPAPYPVSQAARIEHQAAIKQPEVLLVPESHPEASPATPLKSTPLCTPSRLNTPSRDTEMDMLRAAKTNAEALILEHRVRSTAKG